jgi:hypothetical protein
MITHSSFFGVIRHIGACILNTPSILEMSVVVFFLKKKKNYSYLLPV